MRLEYPYGVLGIEYLLGTCKASTIRTAPGRVVTFFNGEHLSYNMSIPKQSVFTSYELECKQGLGMLKYV